MKSDPINTRDCKGEVDGQPDPLQKALDYHRAGLCVLRIRRDGSKAPAEITWPDKDEAGKPRRPTEAEIIARFGGPAKRRPGVAIACGTVSSNLAVFAWSTSTSLATSP